jgi:hypothetical protein
VCGKGRQRNTRIETVLSEMVWDETVEARLVIASVEVSSFKPYKKATPPKKLQEAKPAGALESTSRTLKKGESEAKRSQRPIR